MEGKFDLFFEGFNLSKLKNYSDDSDSDLLGCDIKPKNPDFKTLSNVFERKYEKFRCGSSIFKILKSVDPSLEVLFDYEGGSVVGEPVQEFGATPDYLYHGTSLAALDCILESGMMYPATYLLHKGSLISGELKESMDREKDDEHKGPKFISREAMIKLGMLAEEDPRLYGFGHAGDVVFGNHPSIASSYFPKNGEQAAMLVLDSKVLTSQGTKFIDAGGEGILHDGPLSISFALRQLLVPDDLVEEYAQRTRESYLATVFPLSSVKKICNF